MIDPTVQADTYSDSLYGLSVGTECEILVRSRLHGTPYELHVIRSDQSNRVIERVRHQLALIKLAEHDAIRPVDEPLSSDAPHSFSLRLPCVVDPKSNRLNVLVDLLSSAERLQIAAQLVDATMSAHRVGLYHGSFDPSTVRGRSSQRQPDLH